MEKKILVGYEKLHALEYMHPNSDVCVILVHGFMGNKDESMGLYKDLIPFLTPHFSTLRYDCRGCGENKHRTNVVCLDEWIKDFQDVVQDLCKRHTNIKRLYVIGFSLGATIALYNYDEIDVVIQKMVLLSPAFYPYEDMFKRYLLNGDYESALRNQLVKGGKNIGEATLVSLKLRIDQKFKDVKSDILLIHSEKDKRIPISSSHRALKQFNNAKSKTFIQLSDLGHSFRIDDNVACRTKIYKYVLNFLV